MIIKIVTYILLLATINANAQRTTILIIADDLSADYFGFYPNYIDTVDVPNLRKLVNNGIVFTNNMSNPVCSSTRSGILTGRYSFRTGVGGIVGGIGGSNQLDTAEVTIPKLLKKFNPLIAKANIGKWHLHQPNPASNLLNPLKTGYDHFEGPFIGQLPSFTNWTKYTNGVASNIATYATTENVNNAITWLKNQNNNSVFLWLAFNAPHEPLHLPPANLHTFKTLPGSAIDIKNNPKSYFKAMIQTMDTEIGRLFDSLKAMNRFDSTDFIFIGDNGNTPRTAQIADTSKAKGTVYEYGVHTPLIIAGPSVVNKKRYCNALINTTDIFATVLELQGYSNWQSQIPTNKPVDSKSILPIIKNTATEIRPWQFCEIFKLIHDSDEAKAIRNMYYKLIHFDYGKTEFYNLKKDPLETKSLNNYWSMSADESYNYDYLCGQYVQLTNSVRPCIVTGINEISKNLTINIYPNPFTKQIKINNLATKECVALFDSYGKCVYNGTDIENQDFSKLIIGIYFLKTEKTTIKLIKANEE
ncbi:MAG: sulfatase-like hydrolase/transferase [Candidatus Methylacidiphilales bacterium]